MPRLASFMLVAIAAMAVAGARAEARSGDAKPGAQAFANCAACHSLVSGRNMTGPSLAGVWGRKAGTLVSFERYSPALKASNVVWDEKTLDAWLKSPSGFIPNNRMTFPGIANASQRTYLIAFLKAASAGEIPAAVTKSASASEFQDLKKLGRDHQVQTIRYCHDTYRVTTADGKTADFWESNLRFKTDSSDTGPLKGKPVITPAGMQGDRASVFFAAPEEIGVFIKHQC